MRRRIVYGNLEPALDDEAIGWLSYAGRTRFRYVIVRPGRGWFRVICWRLMVAPTNRYQRQVIVTPVEFFWRE